MPRFRGEGFSTIQQTPPPEEWGREHFTKDWSDSFVEGNTVDDATLLAIKESVIVPLYDDYETCLDFIHSSALEQKDKNVLTQKLNAAMFNVQEYGRRQTQHIVLSLKDRKIPSTDYRVWTEEFIALHNELIEVLIQALQIADSRFDKTVLGFIKHKSLD